MKCLVFVAICVTAILSACSFFADDDMSAIPVSDLLENSEAYVNEDIVVEGQITKDLGERSYLLALPYVTTRPCKIGNTNMVCPDTKISLSNVRSASYEFTDATGTITIMKETGGLYLPIPFSPAGSPQLPKTNIKVRGAWVRDNDGNFYLRVFEVVE